MHTVNNATFLAEMQAAGITLQPGSYRLSFGRYEETDRFWTLPWPPQDVAGLLTFVLSHVAPTTYCDAWRPGGVWHESEPSYTDAVREVLLRGFSIPPEHCGALRFDRSEATALTALVLAFSIASWNINDDLCLVPDNHQYIVRLSHHAVLHVECRVPDLVEPLVAHMASCGWDLPTEVPDPTFKVPSWISGPGRDTPA
ncbi:MAG TPA: hypothetical protein VFK13_08640 [Gemmatimonadaceae bacterium]|nr:hypothetical protein [Gemmatimonadaceae bacterium]